MKRVLRVTHWTVCANFIHPVLKCVCGLKPSFYKPSVHFKTSVIWLQVINTVLASTWGGAWRGNQSIVIGIGEITQIWSPAWNHFFMCWRIDTNWLRVLFDHLSAHLPPVLNKAGNQVFPNRAQAGSMLCVFGFAEGLPLPCKNHNPMSSPPGTAGGIEELMTPHL